MPSKFDSMTFRQDVKAAIRKMGWDVFKRKARTTDKVMRRVLGLESGTISTQTMTKFCNAMDKNPTDYFQST